jgi:ArsR family transcriptional regulator, lead/cadmium/zinc/bismuth-responsive transcriptional repressor
MLLIRREQILSNEFICEEKCPHYNLINKVKLTNIGSEETQDLAEIFKLFADETRLRIICAILNTELCVCDLCELLDLNQSAVSHQLQLLRKSKLVKYRKEGKQVYYSLQDEHIESIIKMALAHIMEGEEKDEL